MRRASASGTAQRSFSAEASMRPRLPARQLRHGGGERSGVGSGQGGVRSGELRG